MSLRKSKFPGLLCHLGIRLHGCARGAPHVRRHPAARHGGTRSSPCFGGAFLLLVSPATTGGSPRAPHPQQGFPGAILPSVPHRGGFFPGEIGNKLLFQKKFGKSRAVGCMFMQKLERTFAMKTQLPGAKARAGGGVGEIPGVWAFSGPVHFVCVLKVYAPGLQNIPEIPGKFRKINE